MVKEMIPFNQLELDQMKINNLYRNHVTKNMTGKIREVVLFTRYINLKIKKMKNIQDI